MTETYFFTKKKKHRVEHNYHNFSKNFGFIDLDLDYGLALLFFSYVNVIVFNLPRVRIIRLRMTAYLWSRRYHSKLNH